MRARWVLVFTLTILIVGTLLYFVSIPNQPIATHPLHLPEAVSLPFGRPYIPTGNLPINKTLASQYARGFIKDYNDLVSSKQANWLSAPSLTRFFPLFNSAGNSWEVLIARENLSARDNLGVNGDWIEFMFVKQVVAENPQLVFYTNESARYLRLIPAGTYYDRTNHSFAYSVSSFGILLLATTTQSPIGVDYYPLIWITNSSSVYNNVAANSKNAAQTIYDYGVQDYNSNLPNPVIAFFSNPVVLAVGFVLGSAASAAFFIEKMHHRRSKLHKPRSRKRVFLHAIHSLYHLCPSNL